MNTDRRAELGFVRVAAATPTLRVADVQFNCDVITEIASRAAALDVRLLVCPELSLTGATCGDLFRQRRLLEAAEAGLRTLANRTEGRPFAIVVGLPIRVDGAVFNCAAVVVNGSIVGLVPKLRHGNPAIDARWFSEANDTTFTTAQVCGVAVPFSADLVFRLTDPIAFTFGVAVGDAALRGPPRVGSGSAHAGAALLATLAAGQDALGRHSTLVEALRQRSLTFALGCIHADAGPGESSTDAVFAGRSLVVENGTVLAETPAYSLATELAVADVDLHLLQQERRSHPAVLARPETSEPLVVNCATAPPSDTRHDLLRPLTRTPFLPTDAGQRELMYAEAMHIQTTALARRIQHGMHTRFGRADVNGRHVTVGISGGADSALALLIAVSAFDKLALPRAGIVAITMPGFGTTKRTQTNAVRIAEALEVSVRTIPIKDAMRQHFTDIGHDENVHDKTFESAQVRERTQILMDIALSIGGFNVGTTDLSELALGYSVYNGNLMAMYNVIAGMPKTLVTGTVRWFAATLASGELAERLNDVCDTPSSPELLPPAESGELKQTAEAVVGPIELQDFFLYYAIRYAFSPQKVLALASSAFRDEYRIEELAHWLRLFYRRFFANQFKRSPLPDGPRLFSFSLSPRGDWCMPSDAMPTAWLDDIDEICAER